MPTSDREIKTFERRYMCDSPNCAGELKPKGMMFMSDPPKYPHACSICGAERAFAEKYPIIAYRSAESV